jgi:hypothetical protein
MLERKEAANMSTVFQDVLPSATQPWARPRVRVNHVVVASFSTAIMAILCTSAAFLFAVVPGLPLGFCPAVPVMVPLGIWFGGWGLLSAYVGCGIGGLIKGVPLALVLPWVVNDLFMAGIPMLAFRFFKADPMLTSRRDRVIFVVFGVVLNSLLAVTWGTIVPVLYGFWPNRAVPLIWTQYLIVSVLMLATITPPILRRLTPYAQRTHAMTTGIFV